MEEARVRDFFSKVQVALKNELLPLNFGNLEVVNNYEVRRDYNITISLTLRCQIRVQLMTELTFPKTGPKVFVTDIYDSPIVNKITLEVMYQSFYLWTGNTSKVSELVAKLDQYFQTYPPQRNVLLAESSLLFREVQNTVNNKLLNLDYSRFESGLSYEERSKVGAELPELLRKSLEFKECSARLSAFSGKGIELKG